MQASMTRARSTLPIPGDAVGSKPSCSWRNELLVRVADLDGLLGTVLPEPEHPQPAAGEGDAR